MSEDKKNKKKEEAEETATDSQIKTIKELYSELNYDEQRRYDDTYFPILSKVHAGEHIEALIKLKRKQANPVPQGTKVFDKIGYSMIYKLVWRDWDKIRLVASRQSMNFEEWVAYEHHRYKQALAFAEKYGKGSGQ